MTDPTAARLLLLAGLALGLPGLIQPSPTARAEDAPAAGPAQLRLDIQPTQVETDPGPEMVVGSKDGKIETGRHFFWTDVSVQGASTKYRVYFDLADATNYHFLDREAHVLTLGLCEGGVPQTLVSTALPEGDARPLRVARHGADIGVFMGHELVASAFDDRRLGGKVGVRNAQPDAGLQVRADARDDIHFTDDFMREDNKVSRWKSINCEDGRGEFGTRALRNPLLSANAFCYMGVGENVLSIIGESWWDRYSFETALRGPRKNQVGLVFAYKDPQNYGLFRWTARPLRADGSTAGDGKRELVMVQDGREKVLAFAPGGYVPDQWYQVKVLMTYERVRVSVDGHPLMETRHPALTSGAAGVWCNIKRPQREALDPKAQPFNLNSLHELMQHHAVFDDVKLQSVNIVEDDFNTTGPLGRGWLRGTGDWKVPAAPAADGADESVGELHVTPGPWPTKSLIGSRAWARYKLAADVDPSNGLGGLVFLYRDETNHYITRTDGKTLELLQVYQDAKGEVHSRRLDSAALQAKGARKDGFLRLVTTVKDGHIHVRASDGTTVEGFEDSGKLHGRAGLWAAGEGVTAPVRFRRFRLAYLKEADPLITTNAIFEDESSMEAWTSPSNEWLKPRNPLRIGGELANVLWHSNQFPGDVELSIEPREILEERHEVALSVAKDGKGSNNGYVFRYQAGRQTPDGKSTTLLSIMRQSEVVAEKVLPEGTVRELSSVSLRRAGKFVIGKINGRPALVYRDEQPLVGSKVAYYTVGLLAKSEASKIISDHFQNELFSNAPTVWRTGGAAIAEVTNRWQCDPRWSFFSLKNDQKEGKLAVLWNKKLYPGDVTVEFYVGNKMEQQRGRPYEYARDINVTICSDGQDLTKGYTFMWGGRDNTGSMIMRNGVEVARSTRTIPDTMRYHRHWFYIRVEKRGNKVTFRVDRLFSGEHKGELVFEDPNPLSGNQIALWTYDHAIMISRVRLSGDGGQSTEHPDREIGPPVTVYDTE